MNIKSLFSTNDNVSTTVLRIGIGLTLMPHGAQKLFGLFGGYGLSGTAQWMDSIGLHPGMLMASLAGSAEFFGGLALVLGLLTRPAAAVTAFTMLVAIFSVHYNNGFFLMNNGYEYGFVLLVACVSLLVSGGGKFSVDAALSR
ncbi:MAG TPA: DoxX family protein [Pseudomonadales bacterium]|nr:DoxX family protein [Pseudomonadales bacterium]